MSKHTMIAAAAALFLGVALSQAASLLVRCTVPGAAVSLDSGETAVTDAKGLAHIADITAGKHQIIVAKERYRPILSGGNCRRAAHHRG